MPSEALMNCPMPCDLILQTLRSGCVIPASPLALDADGQFDEIHQRAVYRYYSAAGAGGIAVGVHTTQFEIRDPGVGLFEPVLRFAAETFESLDASRMGALVRVAGVCGKTEQAVREAEIASSLGYHAGLLSLAAMKNASINDLLEHCQAVAKRIPLIGFYLQPAVGGRLLPHEFWRRFIRIPNVIAIKVAPFNRYQTLDVMRAIALEGREHEVVLYTGNDDAIIHDLLTPFPVQTPRGEVRMRFRGGLLGQWSVWTRSMVRLLEDIHLCVESGDSRLQSRLLEKAPQLTDANAAVFDAANGFRGCIAGINEVLRAQGLLGTRRCLNALEDISAGQAEEIARVRREYRWIPDDDFVAAHRKEWLRA